MARLVALVAGLAVGACAGARVSRPAGPRPVHPEPGPIAAATERHAPALTVSAPVADADADRPGTASVLVTVRLPGPAGAFGPMRARWATHGPGSGESQTAAAGSTTMRLRGLPAGRVWVVVAVPKGPEDAHAASAWLALEADRRTDLAFDFDRGSAVEGRLVDERGRAVADRRVSFGEPTEPPLDMLIASTRSDARGRFRIEGLSRRGGALTILIPPPPDRFPSQAVALQHQVVEDVVPGGPALEIVVREFDPQGAAVIGIGGGG